MRIHENRFLFLSFLSPSLFLFSLFFGGLGWNSFCFFLFFLYMGLGFCCLALESASRCVTDGRMGGLLLCHAMPYYLSIIYLSLSIYLPPIYLSVKPSLYQCTVSYLCLPGFGDILLPVSLPACLS